MNIMKLEGGFLVLYNAMAIKRIKEPRLHYKQECEAIKNLLAI